MSEEIEQVVEAPAAETTPTEITTPEVAAPQIPDQAVTNLDDAKKVLEAQKRETSAKKTAPAKTNSTGPKTDYEKQYKEIQSLVGKQSKELGELRKFYSENQNKINAYNQFLEQQQMAQLQGNLANDPMAVIREVARREALSQMAPVQQHYQEQVSQAQAVQINSSIKDQLGADYPVVAPVMAEILDGFLEMDKSQGSNYATELANNPQILLQMAAGKLAMQNRAQVAQQSQQAQTQKAQNLKTAGGVAKSNTVSSSPTASFKDLPLDEMRAQMKKMGILQ